jgi:hypothetical protein
MFGRGISPVITLWKLKCGGIYIYIYIYNTWLNIGLNKELAIKRIINFTKAADFKNIGKYLYKFR